MVLEENSFKKKCLNLWFAFLVCKVSLRFIAENFARTPFVFKKKLSLLLSKDRIYWNLKSMVSFYPIFGPSIRYKFFIQGFLELKAREWFMFKGEPRRDPTNKMRENI